MQNSFTNFHQSPLCQESTSSFIKKYEPSYKDKTILVTGAGGTIGFELCQQILALRPRKLILLDHSEFALYTAERNLQGKTGNVKMTSALGSVQEKVFVERVIKDNQVDVIFHAAAYKHVPMVEANVISGLANNVLGTLTLANAAKFFGVKSFVLISSDKAVRPTSVMGASKRFAELIIQDLATRSKTTLFSMVRFGNVIGSSGSVIPLFQEQISKGGPVTLTHKEIARYFMTVNAAARLVLIANTFAKGGEVFVLNMGKPVLIYDLAKKMIQSRCLTVRDEHNLDGDIEILITGLRAGEKLNEELFINPNLQTILQGQIFCAKETQLSEVEIRAAIKKLTLAVTLDNESMALAVIQRWVNGYIPNTLVG